MKWILIVGVALIGLVALMTAIGALLPRTHVASRTLRVARTPQEVWLVFEQVTAAASVPVDIIENDPPRRLVTRVKPTEKMFGGTWTCTAAPAPGGSTLTIVEDGWVANPFFRFMSRFVIGHHATIDSTLEQIARALNEQPSLSGE